MKKYEKYLNEKIEDGAIKMIPKSKSKWALTRTKEMKSFVVDLEEALKEGSAGDAFHYIKNIEMWMEDLRNMVARYI